jgi:DNA-directed RNA polymerase specialized sigma24 family protein
MLRNLSPDLPRTSGPTAARPLYSEEAALDIYATILRVCLKAGLSRAESEDIAQDIWTWLLTSGAPTLALTAPWLSAVAQNYVLRYRRRAGRLRIREGVAIEAIPEPGCPAEMSRVEGREVLDRTAAVLPPTERRLLELVRGGHSFAQAAEMLGIPRGSRAYHRARLVRVARAAIRVGT